ncbi:hypothetical protein [Pectobacterium parmentieri]|uniref:hypothetical protein n=1 Tax=Pectobacterium parmentieri TaxID=1905730 RepID=UPI0018DF999E|nr:hypothetical protein [Pectobacterium parmentieri]MBI0549300.1 hypothetical protein [Pectobacterium parmentieri]MBI0558320.1 hypothetical protein [Pectobacterium parmentieri]MBI0562373.1 hypothetical protein [Pectobacterium parmentieri]
MNLLTAIPVGLMLSSPAFALPSPQEMLKSVDWVPDSTVQVGKSINVLYRIVMHTGEVNESWLSADCTTDKKTLLFSTVTSSTRSDIRVYGTNSLLRYIPGVPFEPDEKSLLKTKPELDVCHQTIPAPQWVALSIRNDLKDQYFVDVSKSKREGEILKIRLATDYALTYKDKKYAAPYSIKIQDMILNCKNNQGKEINSYFIDNQGFITDYTATTEDNFISLGQEKVEISKKLCAIRDIHQLKSTGTLILREKALADNQLTLPNFEKNDPAYLQSYPLAKEVTTVIEKALANAPQPKAFQQLAYTQVSPDDDEMNISMHSATIIARQPDGTTLTLDKLTLGGVPFYTQHQRLFNIVELKKWDSIAPSPVVSQKLENTFSLPPKEGTEYHWKSMGSDNKSTSQQCQADKKWSNAKDMSSAFTGRYLEIICTDNRGDGVPMSSDYAYIEDLGIFVRIGYQKSGQKQRFTFRDVMVK